MQSRPQGRNKNGNRQHQQSLDAEIVGLWLEQADQYAEKQDRKDVCSVHGVLQTVSEANEKRPDVVHQGDPYLGMQGYAALGSRPINHSQGVKMNAR